MNRREKGEDNWTGTCAKKRDKRDTCIFFSFLPDLHHQNIVDIESARFILYFYGFNYNTINVTIYIDGKKNFLTFCFFFSLFLIYMYIIICNYTNYISSVHLKFILENIYVSSLIKLYCNDVKCIKQKTEIFFLKKNLIMSKSKIIIFNACICSSYVSYRNSGVRTRTTSGQRNGYNRRHSTRGRRARRGSDGLENNFQVRLSTEYVSIFSRVKLL